MGPPRSARRWSSSRGTAGACQPRVREEGIWPPWWDRRRGVPRGALARRDDPQPHRPGGAVRGAGLDRRAPGPKSERRPGAFLPLVRERPRGGGACPGQDRPERERGRAGPDGSRSRQRRGRSDRRRRGLLAREPPKRLAGARPARSDEGEGGGRFGPRDPRPRQHRPGCPGHCAGAGAAWQGQDRVLRLAAARSLCLLGRHREAVLQTLIEVVRSKDRKSCWRAALLLGEIGPAAKAGLPASARRWTRRTPSSNASSPKSSKGSRVVPRDQAKDSRADELPGAAGQGGLATLREAHPANSPLSPAQPGPEAARESRRGGVRKPTRTTWRCWGRCWAWRRPRRSGAESLAPVGLPGVSAVAELKRGLPWESGSKGRCLPGVSAVAELKLERAQDQGTHS
jgi:hypothetical protein